MRPLLVLKIMGSLVFCPHALGSVFSLYLCRRLFAMVSRTTPKLPFKISLHLHLAFSEMAFFLTQVVPVLFLLLAVFACVLNSRDNSSLADCLVLFPFKDSVTRTCIILAYRFFTSSWLNRHSITTSSSNSSISITCSVTQIYFSQLHLGFLASLQISASPVVPYLFLNKTNHGASVFSAFLPGSSLSPILFSNSHM